ncbi:MAG: TonB-dependent receptor, partial [Tannerella sp.]|nr:TonB-dependent receptor [Tannerella sp.]
YSQQGNTVLSGKVLDETGRPLQGAIVSVKETKDIAATDKQGNFTIKTSSLLPVTVVASFPGLGTQEVDVYENTPFHISLNESVNRLDEVVVTASRKSESLARVPVTVETLSDRQLEQTPVASYYDAIAGLKGVNTLNSSVTFTVYNTRGFQHPTNLRFVQLVDGADNASPELGLPVANTIGPGELDVQRIELIPGASSALYGLNAGNGLLNLITKDPFTYQGLSVSLKSGVNNVHSPFKDVYGTKASPYGNIALRYAKALNDRFAFKVNLGYITGQDWASGDFKAWRDWNGSGSISGTRLDAGYDGANVYGDEGAATNILTLGGVATRVSRTGYAESDLTDYDAKLLHADATLAYKFTPTTQLSYTYRAGEVDNVFTRANKLKLKNFLVQQHVLDFKTSDFTLRTYYNTEDAGDSYNIRYLADALNTAAKPNSQWNADFTAAYNAAAAAGQSREQALQTARAQADNTRIVPGTPEFDRVAGERKNDGDWNTGARYVARGFLWHTEASYDFSRFTGKIADTQLGVDYRYTRAESDGTFYPDTLGADPVYLDKLGAYLQAGRDIFGRKLRLVASVRADKARALDWTLTERIGLIYAPNRNNNFRLSYQNGFRQATFFEAASYNVTVAGIGVGGLKPFLQSSDIIRNSYSYASVNRFVDAFKARLTEDVTALVPQILGGWIADGTIQPADAARPDIQQQAALQAQTAAAPGALVATNGLLEVSTYDYLKPEQNQTIDFSYKGSFLRNKLYVDANVYGTQYRNFIQTYIVVKPEGGVAGTPADAAKIVGNRFTAYQTAGNIASAVYVYGASLAADYNFFRKYTVSGNINYITPDWGDTPEDLLSNGFNTPKLNLNLSIANPNVYKNIGFKALYRWTSETDWNTDFSKGSVPAWQSVDAQVFYRLPKVKTTLALGGTNIFNRYYTQYIGGPSIGGFYYASITFDGLTR